MAYGPYKSKVYAQKLAQSHFSGSVMKGNCPVCKSENWHVMISTFDRQKGLSDYDQTCPDCHVDDWKRIVTHEPGTDVNG